MNKNHKATQSFIRSLRSLTLPKEALFRMREELAAYADLHTVPETSAALLPAFSFSFMRRRRFIASAFAFVLVIATGAEAAFASERTLPGDVLYPVKVAFAEPIALALAPRGEVKAELSTAFASRRIEEAATLSKRGALTDEHAEELAARFEAHIDTAETEADALEAKGDIDAALAVRTDLEQGISEQVETLVPEASVAIASDTADEPSAALMSAKVAVAEPVEVSPTPASRFLNRVGAKARAFSETRAELENAVAIRVDASTDVTAGLASVEADDLLPEEGDSQSSAARVLSTVTTDDTVALTAATSSAATTTIEAATTTEPASPSFRKSSSPASRFFSPFFNQD